MPPLCQLISYVVGLTSITATQSLSLANQASYKLKELQQLYVSMWQP